MKNKIGKWFIIVWILCILLSTCWWPKLTEEQKIEKENQRIERSKEREARVCYRLAVKNAALSPDSVKALWVVTLKIDNNNYLVRGVVRAKNVYWVELEQRVKCIVKVEWISGYSCLNTECENEK